jgi:hypothetical protein
MNTLIRLSLATVLTAAISLPAMALPVLHPGLPTLATETGTDGIVKASIRCRSRTGGF